MLVALPWLAKVITTPDQKEARLAREMEMEAQRVSDGIDEQIKLDKELIKKEKKEKNVIKVLLLGQAESGACDKRFSPQLSSFAHILPFMACR